MAKFQTGDYSDCIGWGVSSYCRCSSKGDRNRRRHRTSRDWLQRDCEAVMQVARFLFGVGYITMPLLFGNMDLTSREWAITALVFRGCTNAQIAVETQTTEHVIESNLRTILDKTGCWNRTEIALWYLRMGVEKERRFHDRRDRNSDITGERRKVDRRHPPQRGPRANERGHEINLEE